MPKYLEKITKFCERCHTKPVKIMAGRDLHHKRFCSCSCAAKARVAAREKAYLSQEKVEIAFDAIRTKHGLPLNCDLVNRARKRKWTAIDKAWVAGLIDGEGCIYIKKRNDTKWLSMQLAVSICQICQEDVDILQETIKLPCYRSDRALVYSCVNAHKLLRAVVPYLRFKKEEAVLGIYFYENCRSHSAKKSRELNAMRLALHNRLREIKVEKKESYIANTAG